MNVLNPMNRKVNDWTAVVGMILAIIDYGMLIDLAPMFPKFGIILALLLRDLQPRIFCGYFLIAALFNECLLSFMLGSVMTAQLVAKYWYGIDLREVGSGNIGWSNFTRINAHLGVVIAVGIAELSKGALAVYYHGAYGAIWALLGHIFCPWTKTGGGKGVAVYLGSALYYSPILGLISLGLKLAMHMYKYSSTESSIIAVWLFAFLSMNPIFMLCALIISLMHRTTSETLLSESAQSEHQI